MSRGRNDEICDACELYEYTNSIGMGDIAWSQSEDCFLFFPTLTEVFDIGGISARSLTSVEGVDMIPLTFFGAGEETTPLERLDIPFIPFERAWGGALQEPKAVGRLR